MYLREDSSLKLMNQPSSRTVTLPPFPFDPLRGQGLSVDVHDIYVDNQHIVLSLWDTAGNIQLEKRWLIVGQEEFDRLRALSYADTHVIMLCFSVESRDSLENVHEKWWDEIARHCEGPPPCLCVHLGFCVVQLCSLQTVSWRVLIVGVKLVLVALKCDLRDDEGIKERLAKYGEKCISYEEGLAMAKQIRAVRYLGIYPYPSPALTVSPLLHPLVSILFTFKVSLT